MWAYAVGAVPCAKPRELRPVGSLLSRLRENCTYGLKGELENGPVNTGSAPKSTNATLRGLLGQV